jgi:hypothetical protein
VRRFNGRLAALPAYDDFTHFAQPMFSLEKAQGTSNAKKVKIAVNWRCVEYEHLVCQLPYVTPEHKQLTQLFMAWADLYVTLRSVAPTAQSTGTMQNEYAPHASCDGSLLDIIARFVMINVYFLSINAKENAGQCGFFALILVSMQSNISIKILASGTPDSHNTWLKHRGLLQERRRVWTCQRGMLCTTCLRLCSCGVQLTTRG